MNPIYLVAAGAIILAGILFEAADNKAKAENVDDEQTDIDESDNGSSNGGDSGNIPTPEVSPDSDAGRQSNTGDSLGLDSENERE